MLKATSLLVVTIKLFALTATPSGVATRIGPVLAPEGTVARISVDETTVKLVVAMLLNDTLVALKKLVPRIVTRVPTGPSVGEKLMMLGNTWKLFVLMITPAGVT